MKTLKEFGMLSTLRRKLAVLSTLAFSLVACGSDGGDAGTPDPDRSGSLEPVVVVVGQAYTPADYLTYVRVFPEVPEGDVDFSRFREFGNANVSVHDGRIFVEQDGTVQRFSVNAELDLVEGPRFSWADFGVPSAHATWTVFISSTRAYTLAPQLGLIVVWDPDSMVRTGTIEFDYPERPIGMETWAYDAHIFGDKVVWNMFSGDWETPAPHPGVILAIANAHDDAPPTFIEDTRCLPGGPSFVDEEGDLYVHGGAYYGYFYVYGGVQNARSCVLRVKSGALEFDPEYVLDYEAVTGSSVTTPWIQVSGDRFLTRAWVPDAAFPKDPDEFWSASTRTPLLIDQSEGSATPYPDIRDYDDVDGRTRLVDGVSYFQISETGYVEGGNTSVVELHPDGAIERFHLTGGFLLELTRLR